MLVIQSNLEQIYQESDMVRIRNIVRTKAIFLKFSIVNQTKIVTAASEIARNTLIYGGGGTVKIEILEKEKQSGLRLIFEDHGPGIANLELAMKDGYTTGGGMGLGMGGSKRLVNEFSVETNLGIGTRILLTKWK